VLEGQVGAPPPVLLNHTGEGLGPRLSLPFKHDIWDSRWHASAHESYRCYIVFVVDGNPKDRVWADLQASDPLRTALL